MPKSHLHLFCTLFFILTLQYFLQICKGDPILEVNSNELDSVVKRVCANGECPSMSMELEDEDSMMMDSESNRRVLLMQKRYISYDTLKRDSVPCDKPGASYYNCKGPGVANTYHRGCEMITRCARGD
ncbi:hypothetical protein BUALT_Bualt14G0030500 [Buddleja alternifolia]|uniref:Rapid ALkalinization Factor n=1 Tax=Buddleja alternifolia TaxID=168488 RepID=A0AAV6WRJ9_9LAMI|nr:hypothetical protein BUALT_Bualt14G0030500 [Buddleja alternifolia]